MRNVSFTAQTHTSLRQVFNIFLYLNIYTLFSVCGFAQQLNLKIEAEITISESLQDSLIIQTSFADYLSLKKEVDTLPVKLQRIGYLDAKLNRLDKENDSTYLATYFFGKKYPYIKVYYSTSNFERKDILKIADNVEDDYFLIKIENTETALQKLNTLQTQNGDAFARLKLQNITKDGNLLIASLVSENATVRTLDSIVVQGYEKFPTSFLKYYAGVKTGKPFNREKLIRQNSIVNNLGFVKSLKAPEVLFRKKTTTAYFYLEKQNNNLFDGILGFATDEETQRLKLNGYINLELNNNLNFGEQLLINYKSDGNEQQNFRAKVKMPYVLKSPFGVGLELKIFKRDSTFVTTDQLAQVTYQINPISEIYTGYKGYESSNLLDEVLVGSTIEDYNSKFLIAGAAIAISQTSLLFPKKTTVVIDTEFGARESKGTTEDQVRASVTANHIFNLNPTNSLFFQNTTQALFSQTYLTNELFRFGGINSIRGFDENSIDASLFSVLNTEYRFLFNQGLFIHSIIDLGYFENNIIDLQQKLYSFGLGLGIQTNGGLLRLNIANGNSEGQQFRFSNTKIHLSLTSRF